MRKGNPIPSSNPLPVKIKPIKCGLLTHPKAISYNRYKSMAQLQKHVHTHSISGHKQSLETKLEN